MSNDIKPGDDAERPINSDALGAVGEGRFTTICASEELICNQGHRDRSGWDFIVEWPISSKNNDHFDEIKNPISAHFQLKSMWYDNDRIKFRMTALERLAKDPKPSFIYITKFNHERVPTEVFICHMIDTNLSIVLKKLRELRIDVKTKINNDYIYLYASKIGISIKPDGKSLREAVEQAIGPDIDAYHAQKAQQLAELGYEPFRNSVTFDLKLENVDEFTDILLGLKRDIPFSSAVNKETRFGIALPTVGFPSDGVISFIPTPRDTCSIIVRRNRFQSVAVSDGIILTAPSLRHKSKLGKILINSRLFKLFITDN